MTKQIIKRLASPLINDVLRQFNERQITPEQACETLGVGKSRLYQMRTQFLQQRALGREWEPAASGGDHAPKWPPEVCAFIKNALQKGYTYAFAASEAWRNLGFETARSQVRHWAIRNGRVKPEHAPRLPAHQRRWQRQSIGELWQLDATTERWFGKDDHAYPLLDMMDDCSRLQVGCAIDHAETIPSYLHFLHNSFVKHGLPLQIFVDQASLFKGNLENNITRLLWRLMFYKVSFAYANSPEAKGKVERRHQVWQERLPPYFDLNAITSLSDQQVVNDPIGVLADWRNAKEEHREIGMTPQAAWDNALAEGRSKLRPCPLNDPWWPYIWSTWFPTVIGARGYVELPHPVGRVPTQGVPGKRATICEHLDGTYSVIKERPCKGQFPILLFSNRPR
jgi:hypothetical protein